MSKKPIMLFLSVILPAGMAWSSGLGATPPPQSPPVWCDWYSWGFFFGQNLVLASAHDCLYKASDDGWEKLSLPIGGHVYARQRDAIYLLGFRHELQPAPIYRSTDGGATWARQGEGPFNSVIPSPKPDWVFATSLYNDPTDGIYKSTDGGVTWKHVFSWAGGSISFSPTFAEDGIAFAVAGGSILKTNTWGDTWFAVYPLYSSPAQRVGQGRRRGTDLVRPQVPWEFG
jgi:photosystem II stability/assembly factor-like uncharacterized protein